MAEESGEAVEAFLGVVQRHLGQRLLLRVVVDIDMVTREDVPAEIGVLNLVLAERDVLGRQWIHHPEDAHPHNGTQGGPPASAAHATGADWSSRQAHIPRGLNTRQGVDCSLRARRIQRPPQRSLNVGGKLTRGSSLIQAEQIGLRSR